MERSAAIRAASDVETSAAILTKLAGQDASVDRLLAKHPNASAESLERLSHSSDRTTRRNVVLNANASKAVLLRLAPQFPGDFFRNPVFDWLLLEDPDLLFGLGQGVLKTILKRADCPQSFQSWAAARGSEQEKLAVAMNPQASKDVLLQLAQQGGPVGEAAAAHSTLVAADPAVDLDRALEDAVKASLGALLPSQATSAWKKGTIGKDQWPWLSLDSRLDVLGLSVEGFVPALLPKHAQHLPDDASAEIWLMVAADPSTSATRRRELFEELAHHEDPIVRRLVAAFAGTPGVVLRVMANDDDDEVRCAVARNPATPLDVLMTIARSSDWEPREALAWNPASTAAVLSELAKASDQLLELDLLTAVAARRATPTPTLAMLAKSVYEEIREAAQASLAERAAGRHSAHVPATSPSKLAALAEADELWVRAAVAGNPSTPARVLSQFPANSDLSILQGLACNRASPASVQQRAFDGLARRGGAALLRQIIGSSACPGELRRLASARLWWLELTAITKRMPRAARPSLPPMPDNDQLVTMHREECELVLADPAKSRVARLLGVDATQVLSVADEVAESAGMSPLLAVRLRGLCHRKVTILALTRRLRSTVWSERMAVARNRYTPANLIGVLTKDPHALVARQAQATQALKARNATPLGVAPGANDLSSLTNEIAARMRHGTRPWEVEGTPWWAALNWRDRYSAGVSADALRRGEAASAHLAGQSEPGSRRAALDALMDELAVDGIEYVCKAVATRVNAPASIFRILAADAAAVVRAEVARNASVPAAWLELLAADTETSVRLTIASRADVPATALARLADDREASVRLAVARNSASSAKTLAHLARDREARTRTAVAANSETPNVALEILARDSVVAVRLAVAKRTGASATIRRILAKDPNERVRKEAVFAAGQSTPIWSTSGRTPRHVLETMATSPDPSKRMRVATVHEAPSALLEQLAADPDASVRKAVARNPRIPEGALELLSRDPDVAVRLAAAGNPAAPWPVLELLSNDDDPDVRRRASSFDGQLRDVAAVPDRLHESNLHHLIGRARDRSAPTEVLVKMAETGCWLVRRMAIDNPSFPTGRRDAALQSLAGEIDQFATSLPATPDATRLTPQDFVAGLTALGLIPRHGDAKAITVAAKSGDWLQRAAMTYCEKVQPNVLRRLMDDEVEIVRQLAIRRLKAMDGRPVPTTGDSKKGRPRQRFSRSDPS